MKNKSEIMLKALIDKVKSDANLFGKVACIETCGTNFATADIAMESKGENEVYKVILVKRAI